MRTREFLWVFFLGLLCGLVGEGMLFLREQCVRAEAALAQDFKVLAFLSKDLTPGKAQALEEAARALPGVTGVRYLSKDAVLAALKEHDASMVRSISMLGENPLGAVVEFRLDSETLPQLNQWLESASKLPELSDLRFKPKEAQAILQLRFYRHFASLVLALAALPWFLGAALGFWTALVEPRSALETPLPKLAVAAAGTIAGMAMIYAAAAPMRASLLWLWPGLRSQWGLFLSGALGGGFWIEPRPEPATAKAPTAAPAAKKTARASARMETVA